MRALSSELLVEVLLERAEELHQECLGLRVRDLAFVVDEVRRELDVRLRRDHLRRGDGPEQAVKLALRDGRADLARRRADDRRRLADERVAAPGPAAPVDGVLERARDAAIVLGRDEQERLRRLERLLVRLRRRWIVGIVVVAVERQVPDRDLGELEAVGREAHESLRELAVDRASREAADDVTDLVRGHGFSSLWHSTLLEIPGALA